MEESRKKVVSGHINPRWPKPRVVKWLEWGAVPAIVGMWFPDWAGQYIHKMSGTEYVFPPSLAFPPLITYIGAVILLKACLEGIRNMGWHYKGARASGTLAVLCAGLSIISHFFIQPASTTAFALTILFIGLAAFFATGFFWFTIAKVAEISTETRTAVTKYSVLALDIAALLLGAVTVLSILKGSGNWPLLLRLTVMIFTGAFLLCRYAVYCYKTQKFIGATFVKQPEEQFWV
ncbi:MAG: hypothetical protein M1510_09920 [Nitrospirae bacterium]|nr:hypothetical protein [Nitrospirota bacterium]